MSKTRTWSRRTSAGLLASVMAAGAMTLTGGVTTASANPASEADVLKGTPTDTLGSHDLELLANAEAKREPDVTIIVATDKGEAKDVAAELKKLGGTVGKQVDGVGYVRARVPTSAVRKAATIPGVAALDLDETIQLPKPEPVQAGAKAAVTASRARREHPGGEPVHADQRDRRGRLQAGAPRRGTAGG